MPPSPTHLVSKMVHRRFYDWMSSKHGAAICFGGILLTIVAGCMYGDYLVRPRSHTFINSLRGSPYFDNIAGSSFEERLCSSLPVDVVYTWVNGSDPQLLADLAAVKLALELAANRTRDANRTAEKIAALKEQASSEKPSLDSSTAVVTTLESTVASHEDPTQVNFSNFNASSLNGTTTFESYSWDLKFMDELSVAISGLQLVQRSVADKKTELERVLGETCGTVEHVTIDDRGVAAIAVFEDSWSAHTCLNREIGIDGRNVTLGPVHFVGNETLNGLVPIEDNTVSSSGPIGFASQPDLALMVAGVPEHMLDDDLLTLVSAFGNSSILHRYRSAGLAVIVFNHRMGVINALDQGSCKLNDAENDQWEFDPQITALLEQTGLLDNSVKDADSDRDNYFGAVADDLWYAQMGDDGYFAGREEQKHDRRHLLAALGSNEKNSNSQTGNSHRHTIKDKKPAAKSRSYQAGPQKAHRDEKRAKKRSTISASAATPRLSLDATAHTSKHRTKPQSSHATQPVAATSRSREGKRPKKHRRALSTTTIQVPQTVPPATVNVSYTEETLNKSSNTSVTSTQKSSQATISTSVQSSPGTLWNYTLYFVPVVRVGAVVNLTDELVKEVEAHSQENQAKASENIQEDEPDEISSSRFQDNSELQYSLRSIEKFAPWVRHIYIVTNGQIPSWLDINHPRISIVTHADIFANKSHLPVFSSPAIEAHLHLIPGLSRQFVYLNDDVMFGTDVWPDDFYTHSNGQKIYEAWPVPNCVDACPNNWINDKYCDAACNNAECDWDGTDCLKQNAQKKDGKEFTPHTGADTCSPGCSDAWLGDKFCDKACTTVECGMDGGDCGIVNVVNSLSGYHLSENKTEIWHVGKNVSNYIDENVSAPVDYVQNPRSFYINMSDMFDEIVSGYHDNPDAVNAAVLYQEYQSLVVVVRPKLNYTFITFNVEGLVYDLEEVTTIDTTSTPTTTDVDNDDPDLSSTTTLEINSTTYINDNHDTDSINMSLPNTTIASMSNETSSFNNTWNATLTNTTNFVRVPRPVSITFLVHVMTLESHEIAIEPNGTLDNTTNVSVSIAVFGANDTVLNYWDMDTYNLTSELNSSSSQGPTTREWYVPPNISEDLLTNETKRALRELEAEFYEGELTEKGLAKYKYKLLSPYLDSTSTPPNRAGRARHRAVTRRSSPTEHSTLKHRRKLHSLQISPNSIHSETSDSDIHTPFVIRNGVWVPRADAELVDWISDQKRKVFSFAADMSASIEEWERLSGRIWKNNSYIPIRERSPFPWERQGTFDSLISELGGSDDADFYEFDPSRWRSRQTKDTFGNSLKKVNRLYNKKFGYATRKVIAHMPHFINRDIMSDLIRMFPDEWDATSSHRLRSGDDMQYAFAYFRYLMELEKNFSTEEAFAELDLDRSGILSVHELRTLITRLYDLPTSSENWEAFETMLLNCSTGMEPMDQLGVGIGPESREVWVTLDFLNNCTELKEAIKKSKGKMHMYKHELRSDEHDISFEMIRDNISDVLGQLDAIRKNPQKFVCLNDNIDHRKKSAAEIVEALNNFYQSFFPIRSQFEHPIGIRNRFLHMEDLQNWQNRQEKASSWAFRAVVVVIFCMILVLYSGRAKRWRRTWLQGRRSRRIISTRDFGRASGTGLANEYASKRA